MKPPQITLAMTSFVVLVLAADFGLIRYLLTVETPSDWPEFVLGLLPIATILVLGLPRLLGRRARPGRFLVGFQASGWAATLALLAAATITPDEVMAWINFCVGTLLTQIERVVGFNRLQAVLDDEIFQMIIMFSIFIMFFALPPLLVALAGGLVARRVGRGRPRAADPAPPCPAA